MLLKGGLAHPSLLLFIPLPHCHESSSFSQARCFSVALSLKATELKPFNLCQSKDCLWLLLKKRWGIQLKSGEEGLGGQGAEFKTVTLKYLELFLLP